MATTATCAVCEVHAESTFRVEGLDCHEEVALIERRFKHLDGLESFTADVVAGRIRVQHDAAKLSTSAIVGAVADAGMRAWLEHEEPQDSGACRDINYDPTVLPDGIQVSDDPILAARSAAYAVSYNRRTREGAPGAGQGVQQ